MLRIYFTSILLILSITNVSAIDYTISGTLKEEKTEYPIAYASVAVYSEADNVLQTGGISNEDGIFKIMVNDSGNYYIVVNVLGFGELTIHNIVLNAEMPIKSLGTIYIKPELTSLNEIVVTAESPAVEYRVDKKVLNLDKMGISLNATIAEALEILPSVDTDVEGNLSLRGSGNFQLLINGKPSPLTGSEALEQYAANQIERIEVITNPTAKYDADNTSGIINLILKKGKGLGLSGITSYDAVTGKRIRQNYNFNSTLTYTQAKYSLSGSISLLDRWRENIWNINHRLSNGENLDVFSTAFLPRKAQRFFLSFDYYITKKHTLTISARKNSARNSFDVLADNYPRDEMDTPFLSDSKRPLERQTNALSLYDHIKLDDNGSELTFFATYFEQSMDRPQTFTQYDALTRDNITTDRLFKESFKHNQARFNIDYVKNFSDSEQIEMGASSIIQKRSSTIETETYFPNAIPFSRNEFEFDIKTHSGYFIYKNQIFGLDVMAGLRLEAYDRAIEHKNEDFYDKFKRVNLFPNLNLKKEINEKQELKLSYSSRISRPNLRALRPYTNIFTNFYGLSGNPNLIPSKIDAFEMAYIHSFKNATFTFEPYYRKTHDDVIRWWVLDEGTNTTIQSPVNIDNSTFYGIESSLETRPLKWLKVSASGSYFKNVISGMVLGTEVNQKFNGWRIRLRNNISLTKQTNLRINGFFNSRLQYPQEYTASRYWFDVSVNTSFLNKKGAIALTVGNVLGTNRLILIAENENLHRRGFIKFPGPTFGLSMSYKFNSFKNKKTQFEFDDENL